MLKRISPLLISFFLLFPILAFAQTAAILPPAVSQFFDNNGNPLASGTVTTYVVGTSTLKTTWRNSAETIPNTNPIILDAGGKAIIYGDGNYRQVVKDRSGNLIWDAVTSAFGSGGATLFGDGAAVGTVKAWSGLVSPTHYVFAYGQELSRVTNATLYTAITLNDNVACTSGSPILTGLSDTTQIGISTPVEAACIPGGTLTIAKTATTVTLNANANITEGATARFFPFGNGNGTTTFNVPDLRGRVLTGRDNMGGTAAGRLTPTYFGTAALGVPGGTESQALAIGNLAAHTHTFAGTFTGSALSPHTHTTVALPGAGAINIAAGAAAAFGFLNNPGAITSSAVSAGTPAGTIAGTNTSTGSGTAFSIVQPTMMVNYVIKVTPDVNISTLSIINSIQGMTGDLTCSAPITCTGQVISATGLGTGNVIGTGPSVVNQFAIFNNVGATGISNFNLFGSNNTWTAAQNFGTFTVGNYSAIFGGAPSTDSTIVTSGNFLLLNPPSSGGGLVGIGVRTPTTALHVHGGVRFDNFGAGNAVFDSSGNISSTTNISYPTLVCNGVTDNVAVINAAITSLAASGGGIVQLPASTSTCGIGSATINLASNVTLKGAGRAATTLLRVGASHPDLIAGIGVSNAFISDMTIDANSDGVSTPVVAAGFSIGSSNVSVERITVLRMGAFGIGFNGVTGGSAVDNYISKTTRDGATNNLGIVAFGGTNNSRLTILRNTVINTGMEFDTSYSKIAFNYITGNGYGAGVVLDQSTQTFDNEITDNTILDSFGIDFNATIISGIENWSPRTIISRNIVARQAGLGIQNGGQYSILTDNIVYDNGQRGTAGATDGINSRYFNATYNGNNSYIGGNRSFNTAGAAGTQEYAYSDQSASVANVVLGTNYFSTGSLGVVNLLVSHALTSSPGVNLPVVNLNSGTGASSTAFWRGDGLWASVTASTIQLTNAHIFVGNGGGVAQDLALSGDATLANTGVLTIANNAVTLAKLATQATNTVLGNATAGTAVPTALAVGTCSTAASALIWTTNTGFGCNTSITAAAVPANGITGQVALTAGGTAANLTASNGGIFYSTASAGAILAGTATAGQVLRSGASTSPSWSTATYPATAGTAANVLRSDGTNFLSAALAVTDLSGYTASTWTPTFIGSSIAGTGQTYSARLGSYEQIGRQVTARFYIVATSLGTAAGNLLIGGLPVTSTATTDDYGSCAITYYVVTGLAANSYGLTGYIGQSSTQITVNQNQSTGVAQLTIAQAGGTPQAIGVCSYHN